MYEEVLRNHPRLRDICQGSFLKQTALKCDTCASPLKSQGAESNWTDETLICSRCESVHYVTDILEKNARLKTNQPPRKEPDQYQLKPASRLAIAKASLKKDPKSASAILDAQFEQHLEEQRKWYISNRQDGDEDDDVEDDLSAHLERTHLADSTRRDREDKDEKMEPQQRRKVEQQCLE